MLYVQSVFDFLTRYFFVLLLGFSYPLYSLADYSSSEFQAITTKREDKVNRIRDEEIQQISSILRRENDLNKKIDLLLRLGRVYTEKYKHYFYKENQIWKKKVDAQLSSKKITRKLIPDHGYSKKILRISLSRLEQLLSIINKSRKRLKGFDEIYYYLGFSYWEIGNRKKATNFFELIIKKYKSSRFITEAYRYTAEYNFRIRKFSKAKRYYEKAARFKNEPTYARTLYKLAWTEYKLSHSKSALEYMKKAILISRKFNEEDAARRGYALDRDIYDAIVLFYSNVRSYKDATNYFKSIAVNKEDLYEILYKLLLLYQHQGRYAKAVAISKQLESLGGVSSEQSKSQQFDILNVALKDARRKLQYSKEISIIKKMILSFVNKKEKDEDIVLQIKSIVRNAALNNHKLIGANNYNKRTLARTVELYNLYISAFADTISKEEYYETRYLLADIYLKWKRYASSIAEYRALLEQALKDPSNPFIQKNKKEIAKALVYTSDIYLKKKQKNYSDKDLDGLLSAIDLYEKIYPGTPESLQFLSRAAGLLKDNKKRYLEYEERLHYFINKYPSSKQAMESAILLLDRAEKKGNLKELLALTGRLIQKKRLLNQDRSGKFKKDLEKVHSRVQFQLVKDIENKKDFIKAAKSYEKLFVKSKDLEVRYKALNNAAVNYEKADDNLSALRVYKAMLTQSPKDRLNAVQHIMANADRLFIKGKHKDALVAYEDFYNIYKNRLKTIKRKERRLLIRAVKNKFLLNEVLHGDEGLESSIQSIITLVRKNQLRELNSLLEELLYRRANKARKAGDNIDAIQFYKRYLQFFRIGKYSIESTVRLAVLYRKIKEPDASQNYLMRASQLYRRKKRRISREERAFAALARLERLHVLEISYRNLPIRLPEKQLQVDIQRKLNQMERLNKGYLEVLEYGDGKWSLEALYRTSLAYLEFAETLESTPIPKSYDEETKAKFKAQLYTISKPVYLKATETLNLAMKKGNSLVVGDPVMAKVYIASVLRSTQRTRYPLAYELDWKARNWIVGKIGTDKNIKILLKNPKNISSLTAVGNNYLIKGQELLAKVFYERAISLKKNDSSAISNLAYLEGKNGNTQAALAGFKAASKSSGFNRQIRKNMGKIYMASGLWRHANLVYRRLKAYVLDDKEVLRGLGLSYLALGKIVQAKELLDGKLGRDINSRFAKAILDLAKGNESNARSAIKSLRSSSSYAQMIAGFWKY